MSTHLHLPENSCFSCQNCGRCCTRWAVPISEKKVQQLRKHDWGSDPFEKNDGPGNPYKTRMVQGRCFFLAENNHCRIHTELSYEAKPDDCKAFPLKFTEVENKTYARLSYYCPTVTENKGKKLEHQMKWVRNVYKTTSDLTPQVDLQLAIDIPIKLPQAEKIETIILRYFRHTEQPLRKRLAAASGLLRRILSEKPKPKQFQKLLETHQRVDLDTLAQEGKQGGKASQVEPLFSLFLGKDSRPNKLSQIGHFFGVRGFNLGLTKLKSYALDAKASTKQIYSIPFEPFDHSELVTRYFLHKWQSKRYLADDNTVLSGFNILALAYGMITLMSRLHAASAGRKELTEEDLKAGVQATDLVVVEHTALHHDHFSSLLMKGILETETLCASILARAHPPR